MPYGTVKKLKTNFFLNLKRKIFLPLSYKASHFFCVYAYFNVLFFFFNFCPKLDMNGDFLNLITRRRTFGTGKDGGLFKVLQRDRTNRICFYLSKSIYERGGNREMDLEELARTIVEAWKDQNPSKGRLAGWSLREEFQSKFKGSLLAEFFSLCFVEAFN